MALAVKGKMMVMMMMMMMMMKDLQQVKPAVGRRGDEMLIAERV